MTFLPVILTMSVKSSARLQKLLAAKNIESVIIPVIETITIPFSIDSLAEPDWVIFFSPKGVDSFFQNLNRQISAKIKIAAVGHQTANTLKKYEKKVDLQGESQNRKSLLDTLQEKISADSSAGKKRIFIPCGDRSERSFPHWFLENAELQWLTVYKTKDRTLGLEELNLISTDRALVFASPSAVESFAKQVLGGKIQELQSFRVYCMRGATSEFLLEHGINPIICEPGYENLAAQIYCDLGNS